MPEADLIFTGGTVITVDPTIGDAQALAVRDGRIAAVGSNDDITAMRGPITEVVDLAGRALLPGFVEPHSHPTQEQYVTEDIIDIRPVTYPTAGEVGWVMGANLGGRPRSESPVIFSGLDPLLQKGFPEPTRELLDTWAGRRPTVVVHNSLHMAWANTAALKMAGVTDSTPDPPGGRFERDDRGWLTGKAYETPAILAITDRVIRPSGPSRFSLEQQHLHLASRGITMCSDMSFGNHARPQVEKFYAYREAELRMRLYEVATPEGTAGVPVDNGDDMLRQIGVKIWVDGSPWVGNIATSFPYLDTPATRMLGLEPHHRGSANYTKRQLRELAEAYFRSGWQLACHVHGDDGVDLILDVYEDMLREHPRKDHRLRLEHCGAMTAVQYQRAAKLGVTCSLFIDHLHYWGDVLVDDLFGDEHGARWMRARSAIDAGVRISFHNDAPVTPEEPLRNLAVACTRTSRSGRVLAPEERITIDEAIRAHTIDAAYQLFADDITGSLTPGKYADLVVLEADPRRVSLSELPDLAVESTYVGGDWVYQGDA